MTMEVSRSHDLSERLVRHAAASAPPTLRERLEEEWLADLRARSGLGSKLRFALGCHWASRVIAIEQPELALATAGHGRMELASRTPPSWLRRPASSLLLVVGLHAALFYVAWSSLALVRHTEPPGPLQNTDIPQPAKEPFRPDEGVNLGGVVLSDPPPVKDFKIDENADLQRAYPPGTDTGPGTGVVPPVDPPRTPHRVAGGPATGFPNVSDFYPSHSVRSGEVGVTAVQVCVNAQGRLEAEPMTVRSSGFDALDGAALKLAKAGSGHYRPTTEDGQPVSSCFAYTVRFQLK